MKDWVIVVKDRDEAREGGVLGGGGRETNPGGWGRTEGDD